jgi:hypothetical protein
MSNLDQSEGYVGVDVDLESEIAGEIGWDFFKKISRPFKAAVRTVGKAAKAVVKSPLVKAGAAGLAMVCPAVGVPLTGALVAADKLISMAESADKARAAVAKTFIKNTKAAAVAGSKDSQRAFLLLRKVAEKKAQVRQMTPAQRVEQVRAQAAAQRARKVAEDFYRQPATSGFLVAKGGRILRGNFVKKG